MVSYFVEQPYVDMVDSARATLHTSINDTSLFAESQIAREALIISASVGDYIRGSLVVLPQIAEEPDPDQEPGDQEDPDDTPNDNAPDSDYVQPEEEEEEEYTPPPSSDWTPGSEGQGGG